MTDVPLEQPADSPILPADHLPQVTTDKVIDLAQLAAELGDGVILSSIGLPHAHPITGHSEEATIYLEPAGRLVSQRQLERAIDAHVPAAPTVGD